MAKNAAANPTRTPLAQASAFEPERQQQVMTNDAQGQDDLQAQQAGKAAGQRLAQGRAVMPGKANTGAIQQQHHAMQHLARTHRQRLVDPGLRRSRHLPPRRLPDDDFKKQRADKGNRRQ
ncbi:hypothetical protein D9M71_582270 [compost metagenome]